MQQSPRERIINRHTTVLLLALNLLPACGGVASTEGRRNHDDQSAQVLGDNAEPNVDSGAGERDNSVQVGEPEDGWDETDEVAVQGCVAPALVRYRYAQGQAFWLGEQSSSTYQVNGFGYFGSHLAQSPVGHYSRAIDVSVGPNGVIEDQTGAVVVGFPMTDEGESRVPCQLRAPISAPSKATSRIEIVANFDAEVVVSVDPFDPSFPQADAISSVTIVDERGGTHELDLYFVKTAENVIEYHVLTSYAELNGGDSTFDVELGVGSLTFEGNGALLDAQEPTFWLEFENGAWVQEVALTFGADILNDGTQGLGATTSFSAPTSIYSVDHDGFVQGTGLAAHVDAHGRVTVEFDSGASVDIGAVALARFPNEDQLTESDGSLRSTIQSGEAQYELPGSPGRGFLD